MPTNSAIVGAGISTLNHVDYMITRVLLGSMLLASTLSAQGRKLRLIEVGSDTAAFDVIATAVVGPTESILFDALYYASDARRMADSLAATRTHLKAIILSHADEDHVSGTAVILERFPGTPVYMTPAGLKDFKTNAARRFASDRKDYGAKIADSLITPIELPTLHFTVDGQTVDVIPDLTGDVGSFPSNSVLWIPALRAALAGDIAFNQVHPWLGSSDTVSRMAWRGSLKRIADLNPAIVVAGHKRTVTLPDSPAVLSAMASYLDDLERMARSAQSPAEIREKLMAKYPDYDVAKLIDPGATRAFRQLHPVALSPTRPVAAQGLQLIQFHSDTVMAYVTATAIVGPKEMILVDALYYRTDAKRMADSLAKLGKRLTAIIVTHPHEDHYFGAAELRTRFPGVPVYMTGAGVDYFQRTKQGFLDELRRSAPDELPDSLITPSVLTSMALTVDGERIEIIPDLQGDVHAMSNSVVWIPSLRAALTGDIVFNGTHPWAGSSDSTTRGRWREAIARVSQLKPAVVVAGHKAPSATDTPAILRAMDTYLADFDAAVAETSDPKTLVGRMQAKYPTYVGLNLLRASAALVLRGRTKPPK